MGRIDAYMCDHCGKMHDERERIIWADTFGYDGSYHDCMCWCNKECLKKWIDEVL